MKICSTQELLNFEILNIKRFASWNGFPRWICDKLINIYTTQSSKPTHDDNITEPTIPIIWIKLPFIGKKGYFSYESVLGKFPAYSNIRWNSYIIGKSLIAKKILLRNLTKAL